MCWIFLFPNCWFRHSTNLIPLYRRKATKTEECWDWELYNFLVRPGISSYLWLVCGGGGGGGGIAVERALVARSWVAPPPPPNQASSCVHQNCLSVSCNLSIHHPLFMSLQSLTPHLSTQVHTSNLTLNIHYSAQQLLIRICPDIFYAKFIRIQIVGKA